VAFGVHVLLLSEAGLSGRFVQQKNMASKATAS
jgi:hypothetical protein